MEWRGYAEVATASQLLRLLEIIECPKLDGKVDLALWWLAEWIPGHNTTLDNYMGGCSGCPATPERVLEYWEAYAKHEGCI